MLEDLILSPIEKQSFLRDADEESKNLLTSTLPLQNKIMQAFGSNHFINNQFDLNELSEIAFLNPINQKILNDIMWPEVFQLIKMTSNIAENNGELKHLASVITPNDNIMRDSLSYKGTRILSFSILC